MEEKSKMNAVESVRPNRWRMDGYCPSSSLFGLHIDFFLRTRNK
jgi:hypothetical protein